MTRRAWPARLAELCQQRSGRVVFLLHPWGVGILLQVCSESSSPLSQVPCPVICWEEICPGGQEA